MEIYDGLLKLQWLTAQAVGLAATGKTPDLEAMIAELQAFAQALPVAGQVAAAGQVAGMAALAGFAPEGQNSGPARDEEETFAQREARLLREEEEIERGFDNMPV